MADMLEPVEVMVLPSGGEVRAFWFTIIVDSNKTAGVYNGDVTFSGTVAGTPFVQTVPVNLTVHKFALPDRVSFRTAHGGTAWYTKSDGGYSVNEFHGVSDPADVKTLIQAYFDVMAENKDCPYAYGAGTKITYDYVLPPQGLGVDAPGNFFFLTNFDFTEFNDQMTRYMDGMHANSFLVDHTNWTFVNTFRFPDNFAVAFSSKLAETTLSFEAVPGRLPIVMKDDKGNRWTVFGKALSGPNKGQALTPIEGYVAYWFAWAAFWPSTDLHS